MKKWIPLSLTLLFAAWAFSYLRGPSNPADGPPVADFGALPVIHEGRLKPIDSVARTSLMAMRKKQSLNLEPWKGEFGGPKIVSATEWLMELWMDEPAAARRPCFRIDNADLKSLLGVPMEPGEQNLTDGKHYAWMQFQQNLPKLEKESERARAVAAEHRTAYDNAVVDMSDAVSIYQVLRQTLGPAADGTGIDQARVTAYQDQLKKGFAAFQARMDGGEHDEEAIEWTQTALAAPLIVPAFHPELKEEDSWQSVAQLLAKSAPSQAPHFAVQSYASMAEAYRKKDWPGMTKAVADYRTALEKSGIYDGYHKELSRAKAEQLFNFTEPFYRGMVITLVALLLAMFAWFSPEKLDWSRRSALALMALVFVILTAGFVWRIALQGRPPVTNLYSSALFVSWAACLVGIILELIFPYAVAVVVSAVVGFCSLLIAHFLALGGDTMKVLQAVLDTDFWLATHVVIVTLGYAATFVAGFLGILFVVRGLFSASLTQKVRRDIYGMTFAVVCFAVLNSFVGTVLGGIWADQSWGRFWGWDPKENGALIIVLWNALILHARLGGLVRERGFMVLCIGGNIVTGWSWFGTNMLGIGLHSYGFMDAAFKWLMLFVFSQLGLIALGLLPLDWWRSFRGNKTTASV